MWHFLQAFALFKLFRMCSFRLKADSKKFHKNTNIKTFKVSNTSFLKDQVKMIWLWSVKVPKKTSFEFDCQRWYNESDSGRDHDLMLLIVWINISGLTIKYGGKNQFLDSFNEIVLAAWNLNFKWHGEKCYQTHQNY